MDGRHRTVCAPVGEDPQLRTICAKVRGGGPPGLVPRPIQSHQQTNVDVEQADHPRPADVHKHVHVRKRFCINASRRLDNLNSKCSNSFSLPCVLSLPTELSVCVTPPHNATAAAQEN